MTRCKALFGILSLSAVLMAQSAPQNLDFSQSFPPAAGPRIRVGGNVMEGLAISKPAPAYPAKAKEARIQGTVKIGILVGTDGAVHGEVLMSGHPLLALAAMESVQKWVYRPTLLDGEPVEVVSTVDVNFTLAQ